jgi:tRNA(Ile)-lysidine synthase
MNNLEHILFQFLDQHYDSTRPLLIGLSGGPDSLALLHLCLRYRFPLQLGLAHVDHGWREESAQEAVQLTELAKRLNLPFYLKKIDPSQLKGNLEAACREERLFFFAQLCREHNYQAVMLGHHADDQAETVLKRIFEGGSLCNLMGLRQKRSIEEMQIWRPFLKIPKNALVNWLKIYKFDPFEDRTNCDPRFLRGRFRTDILPHLEKSFGKNLTQALGRIGNESYELSVYLNQQLNPFLSRFEKGKRGTFLDLSVECPSSAFEIKYIVRQICECEGFSISYALIEAACKLIQLRKANCVLEMGVKKLYIDRGRIFAVSSDFKDLPEPLAIPLGSFQYGDWNVAVEPFNGSTCNSTGWKAAWAGDLSIIVPEDHYRIGPAQMNIPYPRTSSISKWWTDAKVPAFLRRKIPVIWQKDSICHEFLTGIDLGAKSQEPGARSLRISITDGGF